MTVADHWHDLVTVSLLGTDRRDPPEPPPGPLADVVDDVAAVSPSERMLAAVGACVAARAAPASSHCRRQPGSRRPTTTNARWCRLQRPADGGRSSGTGRCWRTSGCSRPSVRGGDRRRTCSSRCCGGTAPTSPAWPASLRFGGPVAGWLYEHQPALRPPSSPRPPGVDDDLPALAVPPTLLPLLSAPPAPVVAAVVGGFVDGTFGLTHRAVLVNFIARARPDSLQALSVALGGEEIPTQHAGLAHSLADLAAPDPSPDAPGAVSGDREPASPRPSSAPTPRPSSPMS